MANVEKVEEVVDVECNGETVRFKLVALDGITLRKMLARLGRLFGAGFVEQVVAEDLGSKLLGRFLVAMRSPDFEREQEAIFETFGKAASIEAGEGWVVLTAKAQEAHFSRRMKLMYAWLVTAMKWQYADFFAGAPRVGSDSAAG